MRLTLRLTWFLVVALVVVCVAGSWFYARTQFRALQRDIEGRSQTTADALRPVIEPLMRNGSPAQIRELIDSFQAEAPDRHVAVYNLRGGLIAASTPEEHDLAKPPALMEDVIRFDQPRGEFQTSGGASAYALAVPLRYRRAVVGGLLVLYDTAVFQKRRNRIWRGTFLTLFLELSIITLIMVFVRKMIIHPIARATRWLHAVRTGTSTHELSATKQDHQLLDPFADEVQQIAMSLSAARATAERAASLRHAADSLWTRERLSASVRTMLNDSRLVVVSNREPYMHRWKRGDIETIVPASGLVTALEPILNACDGTWVAHGSGDADRYTVDQHDHLRVPPDRPQFTVRRVWLEKEEEQGYYYGFANEGLWPLCHIAHTRPLFRSSDWHHYEGVNVRFADAVASEIRNVRHPIIFVQDYHFALLPRLLKERRPDARVAVFWHIPWPNPEAFGICPWQGELLDGLLGADLLGFHVQAHCHNFLHTVDRALECRIDWTSLTAVRHGHETRVKPFPISVDYEGLSQTETDESRSYLIRQPELLQKLGTEAMFLGVGIDRVDYTKGIPERFQGIERFLEKYPRYQGKFTFVQIGAPSRTQIPRYDRLLNEVEQEAARINARFATNKWKPIVFLNRHHTHAEIAPFYKTADLCLVTSLHDGMNLVAKEFLASRSDDEGMLILSRFAGAAQELSDALIVNPYDCDDVADAIRTALEMPPEERHMRMMRMRRLVQEHNVFRWAGLLIGELTGIRFDDERYVPPEPRSVGAA